MTDDPMYDDEWDEQYESGAAPLVALEEQAESHARCLRYWQQQHDDGAARFEAEIARLTDRAKQAPRPHSRPAAIGTKWASRDSTSPVARSVSCWPMLHYPAPEDANI